MFAHFIKDFIHFKRGNDGLDQHRGLDGPLRHAEFVLCHYENIVPQARFEVRFHFRQIQIHAAVACEQGLHIVKKVQREIEHGGRYDLAVKCHVLFIEVPAARARKQHGGVGIEFVLLAVLFERDGAQIGVTQIDLALDHVFPRRAIGVLKVGHEGAGTAVQRIDDHLPVGRAGDFSAPILDVERQCGHHPVAVADVFRFGQEIRQFACIEFFLLSRTCRE